MPLIRCYLLLFSLALLLQACTHRNPADVRRIEEAVDSLPKRPAVYQISPAVRLTETYLDQGNSLISWGDGTYINTDSFGYGGQYHFGELPIDTFDADFIYLQQGCGQMCHLLTILPLIEGGKKREFLFVEAYDIRSKIVAYMPEAIPENWIGIVIEKYAHGNKRDLLIKERFPGAAVECVRECRFADGRFYIGYDGEGNIRRQRSFDIDSLFTN